MLGLVTLVLAAAIGATVDVLTTNFRFRAAVSSAGRTGLPTFVIAGSISVGLDQIWWRELAGAFSYVRQLATPYRRKADGASILAGTRWGVPFGVSLPGGLQSQPFRGVLYSSI